MADAKSPRLSEYFRQSSEHFLSKAANSAAELGFGRPPTSGEEFNRQFYLLAPALSPLKLVSGDEFISLSSGNPDGKTNFVKNALEAAYARVASDAFASGIPDIPPAEIPGLEERLLAVGRLWDSIEEARTSFTQLYGPAGDPAFFAFSEAYDSLVIAIPRYVIPVSGEPEDSAAIDEFDRAAGGLVEYSGGLFRFPFTGEEIVETVREAEAARKEIFKSLVVLGADVCEAAAEACWRYHESTGAFFS